MTDIIKEKNLANLVFFCDKAFPLLYWMHKPVPPEEESLVFMKMNAFFMFTHEYFPQPAGRTLHDLWSPAEIFFRIAGSLHAVDLDLDARDVNYIGGKMQVCQKGFFRYFDEINYGSNRGLDDFLRSDSAGAASLGQHLFHLQMNLSELANEPMPPISPVEHDAVKFLSCVLSHTLQENGAKKRLGIPEGLMIQFQGIVDYAFRHYLGFGIPGREQFDIIDSFYESMGSLVGNWEEMTKKS